MTMVNNAIRMLALLVLALSWGQLGWADNHEAAADDADAEGTEIVYTEEQKTAAFNDNPPDTYVVVKGDTLWDISNRFLKNPWMWPEIWHVNPQIANPHLIFPGDTINLIYLEGSPRLTVKRGEAGMAYMPADDGVGKDGKLEPQVRVLPLEEPIPAIPLDIIDPFLTGNRIVSGDAFESAPYVVQGSQRHVISGAGSDLYARGTFDDENIVYGFFRQGEVYKDDETGEILGIQAIDVGTGKMKSKEGDIGRLSVVRNTQEVRSGDRLLVNQERRVESIFYPSSPTKKIRGNILDIPGGVNQTGPMGVVLVSKGEREGLKSGNILAIQQRGELAHDFVAEENIRLPSERSGLLMVFAVFEKLSYGIVLYADRPVKIGDKVREP